MNLNEVVQEVLNISKDAGAAILRIYNQQEFQIDNKADSSPLTEADKLANNIICSSLSDKFPNIPIQTVDERFSSKTAVRAMVEMGMKKKDRQVKQNVDLIAATILLQEYLNNKDLKS